MLILLLLVSVGLAQGFKGFIELDREMYAPEAHVRKGALKSH